MQSPLAIELWEISRSKRDVIRIEALLEWSTAAICRADVDRLLICCYNYAPIIVLIESLIWRIHSPCHHANLSPSLLLVVMPQTSDQTYFYYRKNLCCRLYLMSTTCYCYKNYSLIGLLNKKKSWGTWSKSRRHWNKCFRRNGNKKS